VSNDSHTVTVYSTDRTGGVSSGSYQALNLSYGVGDTIKAVTENRKRLKMHLNIHTLFSAKQVHGDTLFIAEQKVTEDIEVENYDALMTNISGIGLMIQQADCQAVTLFDPIHKAVAAIHCGWKGSVSQILGKTIQAMKTHYKSSPSDLYATISPSLGPCCAEFTNHAKELLPSFLAFQVKENYFDFWKISEMQLLDAGLQKKNVRTSGKCTSCSQEFFSYRRACRESDGKTGRCATVIILR